MHSRIVLLSLLISLFYHQKVEEFFIEIKETEAEVDRWREACELEVEAGQKELEEREKVVISISLLEITSLHIIIVSIFLLISNKLVLGPWFTQAHKVFI